jgi:hypothetical protein
MISEQDVAGLTIETAIRCSTSLVLRALTSESEVNGDALQRNGRFASGVSARRRFLEFGSMADGAGVENRVGTFEMRNAVNMLVRSIEIRITWVTKALVPQKAFGRSAVAAEGGGSTMVAFGRRMGEV